jgi:hypothetical protein
MMRGVYLPDRVHQSASVAKSRCSATASAISRQDAEPGDAGELSQVESLGTQVKVPTIFSQVKVPGDAGESSHDLQQSPRSRFLGTQVKVPTI